MRRLTPVALLLLAVPAVASAQTAQPVDGTLWSPSLSIDPDALPHVEGTRLPGRWNWNAGVAAEIVERPYAYVDSTGQTRALVEAQLWTHYIVQLGLCPCAAIALELPVMLWQDANLGALGETNNGAVGFGDVRAVGRWSTRHGSSATSGPRPMGAPANRTGDSTFLNEGPGFGVELAVTAPTGDPHALAGAGAWTVHPSVIGDFRLFGLLVAVQAGYRFRFDSHWPDQSGSCDPMQTMSGMPTVDCLSQTPLRDAVTWSAGLRIPSGLLKGIASPFAEVFGAFDARNPGATGTTPIEVGGGLQRTFGELTATLAASAGVTDAPGAPRVRGMVLVQWAPRFIDEDGDGLRDNTGEDQCVGLPEDRDGYQDNDGCPEDNDTDEIPDSEDRCPNENEDVDGFQDDDGCPDPDNDNDGVLDAEDRCPNVAMGAHPDEHRPGCPNDDLDGDGVPNEQDRCPSEPQGSAPDPSRPGCPLPDRDHDGVADANDACPDESAAPGASPEQSGCPELDHDHDGVLDEHDRCPDQPETINGFQDDDGCPEAHPPASARPLVRIVHAHPGDVGAPELLVPIQFTARDQLDHASEGAVAQLALALVATSRRPSRYHQVTVALTPPSAHGPAAVDAARATRRRDALVTALRAHGAPEWAVRGIAPMAPPPHSRPSGIILETVDHIPTAASAAPASAPSSVPASAASSAPSTGSPSPSPAPATR